MKTQTMHLRQTNWIEKTIISKWFWLLAIAFFFSYPIFRSINRELPKDLPVYFKLPDYQLINEDGQNFGSMELKGKVYIANFVFTSCTTICPQIFKKTQKVQHRLRGVMDRVGIVSFSVDPQTDTPAVLKQKALENKAKPFVWRFLTGDQQQIKNLLVEGFKVPMGDKILANNVFDVAHANKYVLVDGQGQVRGYYDIEDNSINKMMIDIGLLINRSKN